MIATLAVIMVASAAPPSNAAGTVVPDLWSAKSTLKTTDGWYAAPVHSALLPDGRILAWGLQRPVASPTPATATRRAAWAFTPTSYTKAPPPLTTVHLVEEPVEISLEALPDGYREDDLYCSGHALTALGKLFTAGGNRRDLHTTTASESYGVDSQTLYDYQNDTWSRLSEKLIGVSPGGGKTRWYPTVTKLPDGRMLIQGGFDKVLPTPVWNGTAEIWDPNTNSNVLVSPYGWTPPELMNSSYTHSFVLPKTVAGKDVLSFGEPGAPTLMGTTTSTASWAVRNGKPRPGSEAWNAARVANGRNRWDSSTAPGWGASTTTLELQIADGANGYRNGAVVIAGGPPSVAQLGQIDTYDPVLDVWRPGRLEVERNFPLTIGLPDGRILTLGGGGTTDPDVRKAEYLDPRANFATALGSTDSGEVRGYHATGLLLPDGRVFLGGGRDISKSGTFEKPSLRYYYPDYMKKVRPQLLIAPTEITAGSPYAVWTDKPVSQLVMVALGSQTHSIDMNQRVVELPVLANIASKPSANAVIAGSLPSARTLLPGFYMLFALDSNRVPSIAKIVKVNSTG